jgi:hypothetical protein
MLLLDAQSKGKPINIFNKAEHNEGQCLPDDDDIPSFTTNTLSETCPSKGIICMQF